MQERVNVEKQHIIDFLTGAENSGKVWFSTFYISPDIGNPDFADLVQPLQAIELQLLNGKPLPYEQLIALVDYIRKSELFPEWQNTETARLFEPHVFANSKQSGRYWW